jgi:hypothetical protein
MGTHMNAYVELDYDTRSRPFTDPTQVYSLTDGSFALDKHYRVFDAIAGGRNSVMAPEDQNPARIPLIAPRGMPAPCSAAVAWDYYYMVAETADSPDTYVWPAHQRVLPSVAEDWLAKEGCHEAEFVQWFNCGPKHRNWRVVSAPGLYNASWLALAEFDLSLEHHSLDLKSLPIEYRIIRTAMLMLVDELGPERVRLVVWFS